MSPLQPISQIYSPSYLLSLDMNNYYNFQDSFRLISISRARAGQVTLTGKRGCDSEQKKGVLEKENRSKRLFCLFLKFLHQVGKCESALFFPTSKCSSHRVFHGRGFNEVDEV